MYLSGSNGVLSSYFWNTNSRKFNPLVIRLSLSKCAVINPRESWAGGGWQSMLAQWMEAKCSGIQCLSFIKELWFIFPDGFCCLGLTDSLPLGPDLPIYQRWSCLVQMVEGTFHQLMEPFAAPQGLAWTLCWSRSRVPSEGTAQYRIIGLWIGHLDTSRQFHHWLLIWRDWRWR